MVINVGIDSILGAIPFIGDLFDFAYKSNAKNVEIYREALRQERHAMKDWSFVISIFLVLAIFISIPIFVLLFIARYFTSGSIN
jgi:hypothetical protein